MARFTRSSLQPTTPRPYERLTDAETEFVDDIFNLEMWSTAKRSGITLPVDGRIERAVDELSRVVIHARK